MFEPEDVDIFSNSYSSSSSSPTPSTSSHVPSSHALSGIKLIIPALRRDPLPVVSNFKNDSLPATTKSKKNGKSKKKKKNRSESPWGDKIARTMKLKPLREVLSRLISQIKRKDSYAFFLHPVNPALVPGYTDVVKRPMDFGTMSVKVSKGKYRSLEEFAADFTLVTSNARLFNPPETIYYTEAERIEAWGMDHIAKSSGTVIQYETDWNIDVEGNASEKEEDAMDIEENEEPVEGKDTEAVTAFGLRRTRHKPAEVETVKEPPKTTASLDDEGHLPGWKDGIGQFPANSTLAKTMFELKLKGKKYKTKKERLRFEKEGPPYRADGSLDYWEVEDPFTILQALIPDPPIPRLYLTPFGQPSAVAYTPARSVTPQTEPLLYPTMSLPRPEPQLLPTKKHWHIARNVRINPRDADQIQASEVAEREPTALDYGSLAILSAELHNEMLKKGMTPNEVLLDTLELPFPSIKPISADYFSAFQLDAEDYTRDIVYGGAQGLAYARSLAEFTSESKAAQDYALRVMDDITEGRHAILRRVGEYMRTKHPDPDLESQIHKSLHDYPIATRALLDLVRIYTAKIDVSLLLRSPEELYKSEEVWAGRLFHDTDRKESPGEMAYILDYTASLFDDLLSVKFEEGDKRLDDLRMNLLALVKRAPLDGLAALPKELVPESVRTFIPTID